jgi:sodium-dependent dicarboxylate transporter 2/3/5
MNKAASPEAKLMRARFLKIATGLSGGFLALFFSWFVPPDWEPGDARLVVEWSAENSAGADVSALGSTNVEIGSGQARITELTPERVEFCLIPTATSPLPPQATLELPGGHTQVLPVTGPDEDGCFISGIRPLRGGRYALALLVLVAVFLTLEVIPLHWTALAVPVFASIAGLGSSKELLAPFFHPVIALFFAGFLLAAAMARTGLDRAIAVRVVKLVGHSAGRLYIAMILLAAFLSMWMSNTASMAAMLPVLMAVTEPSGDKRFRRCMILATAYAASIGGIGSAIGTPANPLAMAYLSEFDDHVIGFAGWFRFGLPMVVLLLPAMAATVWFRYGGNVDPARFKEGLESITRERRSLDRSQWIVLAIFGAMVAGWLSEIMHGQPAAIVGLAGVIALGTTGQIGRTELRSISWDALLVFGGGLCLGDVLVASGASDWVATQLAFLGAAPPSVGIAAVATLTLVLSAVASNTASAATILPLAIPLATVIGVPPATLVVVIAIASSIDFALVVGTPPTMIAYSTGLFTVREIFTTGVVVDLIGLILLIAVMPLVWSLIGAV